MIETILGKMHNYVRDVVSRVEDDFDDCVEFEDYITESVIKNTKNNLETLGKYLGCKSYKDLIDEVMSKQ